MPKDVIGPLRHLVRRSGLVAKGGKAEVQARTRNLRPSIAALRKVYSITSSAIESTPDGMVRPSALTVFRLMTSWNLVGR